MDGRSSAWKPVQKSEMVTGDYSKQQLIEAIGSMTPEEFNRFCREILYLTEFYDTNQGAWVTDMKNHVAQHKDIFWPLQQIDFDRPVHFTIIQ